MPSMAGQIKSLRVSRAIQLLVPALEPNKRQVFCTRFPVLLGWYSKVYQSSREITKLGRGAVYS